MSVSSLSDGLKVGRGGKTNIVALIYSKKVKTTVGLSLPPAGSCCSEPRSEVTAGQHFSYREGNYTEIVVKTTSHMDLSLMFEECDPLQCAGNTPTIVVFRCTSLLEA